MTIKISFPDKNIREYEAGVTGEFIANSISKSLAKAALAVKIDGNLQDLYLPIEKDCAIEIVTPNSADGLDIIRHDAAHLMAEAVKELFPETQVTIGPAIENGFYYDFARDKPFSTEDLAVIEKKMTEISQRAEPIRREEWERDKAVEFFTNLGEKYKAEIIASIPADQKIGLYRQGNFIDLCRGPHAPSTAHVKAFKLMKVAGAYWRGDSKNAMLQRIYGTAWADDKQLKAYLTMLEEAEKRDHRKLGRELGLFHFQEEAQGSVFWHPRGFTVYNQLENYIRSKIQKAGYVEVKTPQLMNSKFWEASGHWSKFRENMFVVPDVVPNTEEGEKIFKEEPKEFMALKPMNCPAHIQIFKQGMKSYRDLPIRMAEFGCCHRNEPHGALHGLMRVRQMTQDDAHIFCREEQIMEEVKQFLELFNGVYKDFGFDDIKVLLATRPEVRAGDDATWDKAEKAMADALDALGIKFEYAAGEGAFYGPKYEFHLKDAIGRSWQCGTCQLDFVLPERLDVTYIGEDGNKHRPVMIHRAILGTLERFIGILTESTMGKFPLWLAPVQVMVTTITNEVDDYALEVKKAFADAGLRVEADTSSNKITYKIREHSNAKIPLIITVGAREKAENTVSIRRLGSDKQESASLAGAIKQIAIEAKLPA